MSKPVEINVFDNSRLFVTYSDGISLENLLNDGDLPEFNNPDYLIRVAIDHDSNEPVWPN